MRSHCRFPATLAAEAGGGNSSSQNSSTSVTITIPKSSDSSSDINLLGDFTKEYAEENFRYEIYYKKDTFESEHKTEKAGGTVTFPSVKYDTYTFYAIIWTDGNKKTQLKELLKTETVSSTNSTVQFPDQKLSDYSQWYFVSTEDELSAKMAEIEGKIADGTYSTANQAIICLRADIETPLAPSVKTNPNIRIEENGFKLAQLYAIMLPPDDSTGATFAAKIGETTVTEAAENDSVTITITPAPGYEIETLKKGETADDVIEPSGGVYSFTMGSSAVTITSAWKALEEDTCDVGSGVLNNGKFVKKDNTDKMSDAQKAAAIAVIFDATNKKGVGLAQKSLAWALNETTGYTTDITDLGATKDSGSNASNAVFSGNGANDGSNSLATIKSLSDYNETNYPAWYWIEHYADADKGNITVAAYKSDWYMPAINELCDLYRAKDTVNTSISKTNGTQLSLSVFEGYYWSSSQYSGIAMYAWYFTFGSGVLSITNTKGGPKWVRAIRAF